MTRKVDPFELDEVSLEFDPSIEWPSATRLVQGRSARPRNAVDTSFRQTQRRLWRTRSQCMKLVDPAVLALEVQRWTLEQVAIQIAVESMSDAFCDGVYGPELRDTRWGMSSHPFEDWITLVIANCLDERLGVSWNYSPEISRAIHSIYIADVERLDAVSNTQTIYLLTD